MSYKRIDIEQDFDPESPREWDNLGTMICSHGRYTLGDEQFNPDDYEGWADLEKSLYNDRKAGIVLPLWLYDHSGINMYIPGDGMYRQHEAWDAGQVGFIYVTQEDLEKEYGVIGCEELEFARKCLQGEVQTYSQYLEGDVWCVTAYDKDGEIADSMCGLYGQDAVDDYVNELKGLIGAKHG